MTLNNSGGNGQYVTGTIFDSSAYLRGGTSNFTSLSTDGIVIGAKWITITNSVQPTVVTLEPNQFSYKIVLMKI